MCSKKTFQLSAYIVKIGLGLHRKGAVKICSTFRRTFRCADQRRLKFILKTIDPVHTRKEQKNPAQIKPDCEARFCCAIFDNRSPGVGLPT